MYSLEVVFWVGNSATADIVSVVLVLEQIKTSMIKDNLKFWL
jgi:hypothetical protein